MDILITIVLFFVILGVLVLVHEFGHYIMAIRNGIGANEFGFGFPPRLGGFYKDENGKWKFFLGNKEYQGKNTLFSLNAIPLGGFVRIKGENGDDKDEDSFATKSAWTRFKVLIAGVTMNLILAWFLFFIILMMGAPESFDENTDKSKIIENPKVQINSVEKDSPADKMGLKIGDNVVKICFENQCQEIKNKEGLKNEIMKFLGKEIQVSVLRGKKEYTFKGSPRAEVNENQGALGISMTDVAIVRYNFFEAILKGFEKVLVLTIAIFLAFFKLIYSLFFGQSMAEGVSGPIGIAFLVQQMKNLGLVYLLLFTATISINLAVINALPIPALDGGRILFLIIEKIKGKPVDEKIEGIFHSVFLVAFMVLALFITIKEIFEFF